MSCQILLADLSHWKFGNYSTVAVGNVAFVSEILCCMTDFQEKLVCFTRGNILTQDMEKVKVDLVRTGEGVVLEAASHQIKECQIRGNMYGLPRCLGSFTNQSSRNVASASLL